MLNAVTLGEHGAHPPLLIVPGLFGSARNWGAIGKRMATDRRVTAVDMRNHGDSPWHDSHGYSDMAGDLAQVLQDVPADILGHSMGGKAAMTLALTRPDLVNRLVVADIAPVAYDHSQMDYVEAMQAVDPSSVSSRRDLTAQLGDMEPEDAAFLAQSFDRGEKRWRLNLDVLAREMPAIMGFPDLDARFDGPALFLSGGASDYVQDAHRPAIEALFPAAAFHAIEGAGHWLHAEKPAEVEAALRAFLD